LTTVPNAVAAPAAMQRSMSEEKERDDRPIQNPRQTAAAAMHAFFKRTNLK
jgi:hypothetical protein